jgi:ATP-dependent helicase/nuclease subunit A
VAQPVWNLTKYRQQKTVKQVMAVLNDPEFSALFGANSRAEVSIGGFVEKDGRKQSFSAQIDRLVVEDKTVLIVDYKNNRRVPEDISQVSHDYIVQMAAYKMAVEQIYPDKEVKCALLYTQEALLIPLPAYKMAQAIARIGLAPMTIPPLNARQP